MGNVFFGGFEMASHNGEFSGLDAAIVVPTQAGAGTQNIIAGGRSGAYQNEIYNNYIQQAWLSFTTFMFPSALAEFFFQIALASNAVTKYDSADQELIRWKKGATVLGGIKYNFATDMMDVYTGAFAVKVGSFQAPPGNSTFWVFEIHLVLGDSGSIEIRKDMTSVFTFPGDTKPGADADVDRIEISNTGKGGSQARHFLDDFILNDITGTEMNSWPGGLRISCLAPTSDDGTNQWSPTPGGSHYTTIDELPPSGTDYLATTANDQIERFCLADLPGEAVVVKAVKAIAMAKKDGGAAPTKLKLGLTIGGVDYQSDDLALPLAAAGVLKQWNLSPATGVPFTVAEVNAMKMTLESRA